ncbi:hypothetical protein R1flu_015011 [Riccia fluitans]|uniref:Uncharacterized protein n=1 Tax=Riccia fluitans TaxID=41844 RepID=A0ABD1YIK8_9MARC
MGQADSAKGSVYPSDRSVAFTAGGMGAAGRSSSGDRCGRQPVSAHSIRALATEPRLIFRAWKLVYIREHRSRCYTTFSLLHTACSQSYPRRLRCTVLQAGSQNLVWVDSHYPARHRHMVEIRVATVSAPLTPEIFFRSYRA